MGRANLRIDCSRMAPSAVNELIELLELFVNAQVVGGDLILINERIHKKIYNQIWSIIRRYDVDVD